MPFGRRGRARCLDVGVESRRGLTRNADRLAAAPLESPGSRDATLRSVLARFRKWKKSADSTAAIGIPKITPAMPATFEPMRTEPRTTIGWMPTAPCMIRGWSTFIAMNQPMPMIRAVGSSASGWNTSATRTGGTHDTNGPKNGIAIRTPAVVADSTANGSPNSRCGVRATKKYDSPMIAWPRRKPPNEREVAVCSTRLLGVRRRNQPEQEGPDLGAVEDHPDRQEERDEQRAEDADAGDGQLLQLPDELAGEHVQVRQHEVGLLLQVDLGVAERREPLLVGPHELRQLARMAGISRMNWSIEDASAAEAATRIASPTTTTRV